MDFTFTTAPKNPDLDCFVYQAHSPLDELGLTQLRHRVPYDLFGHPLPTAADPRDAFTPHTVHILIMVLGEIVAATEMVTYSPLGLPADRGTPTSGLLRQSHRLAECRRPVVRPDLADRVWPELPHGLVGGLVKGCLHWSLLHDMSRIVADVVDEAALKPMLQLGFTPVPGRLPHGPHTLAAGVAEVTSRAFLSTNPFYRHLLDHDESVQIETRSPDALQRYAAADPSARRGANTCRS